MAYETRDNSGSLFRNAEKRSENGPDYSGTCRIDGQDYFFDGWLKKSEKGTNWMSFSFKRKEAAKSAPQKPARRGNDFDDVPF